MNHLNFFQQIFPFLDGADITLSLSKKNDKIAIIFNPNPNTKDPAKKHLTGFSACETPEELDKGFIHTIEEPMIETLDWSKKSDLMMDQLEKSRKEDAAQRDLKAKQAKQKKDIDKLLKEAKQLKNEGEKMKALEKVNQALSRAQEHKIECKAGNDLKTALTNESIGLNLFPSPTTQVKKESPTT